MLAVREETFWDEINGCEENKWAAAEFGLVVSRQNGKGSILEARELAGLFLFGEMTIIHSAHLFDTSRKHFQRIKSLIEGTPELRAEVLRISNSHGDEGIYLKSGQELLFKARSKSGSRGFSADLIVFDEAMLNLGTEEVEAALPAGSAMPNSQYLYMGSAGTQESEHFGRARNRGLKAWNKESQEIRFGWMEWSIEPHSAYCEPDCTDHDNPDDPKSWAKSNPGMGFRPGLTEEYIRETELKAMSPDGFAKERLGVGDWPAEGGGWKVIPQSAWHDRGLPESQLVGKFCLAIDSAPDATYSCITAAGANEDKETHVEITGHDGILDYKPGIKWVVTRVLDIWRANKPHFVVLNPANPAGSLKDELESHGVKVVVVTPREYAQACGDFKNGIAPKPGEIADITHIDQAPLTLAAANADSRKSQDLWTWDRLESASDITPITCSTLAVAGFKKHLYKKVAAPWVYRG